MVLEIPDRLLAQSTYTVEDFKLDVAVVLYQRQVMSLARAAEWVGFTRIAFQKELKTRGIFLHYEAEDLQEELKAMKKIGL